jgi:hypothetical protein
MNPKGFTFSRHATRDPCPLALSSLRQLDEVSGAHQIFQVAGFHLLAGHDLLDGRELENHTQNGGHGAMIPVGLIVEDQVLQLAPLDGYQHGAVRHSCFGSVTRKEIKCEDAMRLRTEE